MPLWGQSFQRAAAQVPDENRKQVVEALGPPFIVFREKVLDELKVSDEQREKLMQYVMEQIMETGPFLDSLRDAGPEGVKKLNEHRKNALGKLRQVCKRCVSSPRTTESVCRAMVTLQRDGGFQDSSRIDVQKDLEISPEQRKKFTAIMRELQENIQVVVKACVTGGKPEELGPKNREAPQGSRPRSLKPSSPTASKKQWKELLGPPFELGD